MASELDAFDDLAVNVSQTLNRDEDHPAFAPAYLTLLENGMLAERVSAAWRQMNDCDLCARYCHINRMQNRKGAVCRTGEHAVVHSFGPHHGEEDPLRGSRGSGTICAVSSPKSPAC